MTISDADKPDAKEASVVKVITSFFIWSCTECKTCYKPKSYRDRRIDTCHACGGTYFSSILVYVHRNKTEEEKRGEEKRNEMP